MYVSPIATMNLNITNLLSIAEGQSQRTIVQISRKGYLSKMKVLTNILNGVQDLRHEALELDEDGVAMNHTGEAHHILKLKLPMSELVGKLLFAAVSIDGNLPRKRKRGNDNAEAEAENIDGEVEIVGELRVNNEVASTIPGYDVHTVSAQTYQNYKSALKWWHELNCNEYEKVGHIFPAGLDTAINGQIATYKRDIGEKKRRGVMPQKEGKSPYDLTGYISICKFFNSMIPVRNKFSWLEGMFASLFTKLSVNTIGRSDNIDDLLLSNIGWENDALTIRFCTTKSDQAGEKTSEIKRIFANPFKPDICVIFGLALYTWCKRRSKML